VKYGKGPNISVKYIAITFRVEEEAKQETSWPPASAFSCLAYSSTLKMEALYFFETSALSEWKLRRFTIICNKCNCWNIYKLNNTEMGRGIM
jgi:hypothetical protein